MVQRLLKKALNSAQEGLAKPKTRKKKVRPDNHIDMKLGTGWHKRNFLAEVVIPSLFTKRTGDRLKPKFPELKDNQIGITWIGHASFLIQTREHSILIDPNWAKWLKVIKRIRHPGIEIHDLPAIDLVLVTHAHFDHLDRKTLRTVARDQPIIVPEHVGNLVHGLGFDHVRELCRWQTYEMGSLKITLTPASHWGARLLHDHHRGFGGFLIEYEGRSIFHCGDSAYFDGFKEIGERTNVEIALLPIGAYDAPTKRDVHMNPEEALQAFQELKADRMIPMHYGTFRLSYEPMHEPPERLLKCADTLKIGDRISILTEGMPQVF
ncbi:MAG: MBL fold metallo-hydrolase [Chthoniobacterales bacterium]